MNFEKVERWRKIHPLAQSMGLHQKAGDDFGWFEITRIGAPTLYVMAAPSDSEWQHVSVSTKNRCPTWEEMCFVKGLFWDDEECVIQLHPPKSEWISNAKYCLHLWRWTGGEFPRPPSIAVGIKELGELCSEIERLEKVNDMTNLINDGLRRVLANARIVNNANPDIRLTNALRDYDKNPLPASSAESKERLSNTIIEQLQRAHKTQVGELVEALERADIVCTQLARWRDAWCSQDTSDADPARRAMLKALKYYEEQRQALAKLRGGKNDKTSY